MKLELKGRKLYCAELRPPVLIAEFNDELIHDAIEDIVATHNLGTDFLMEVYGRDISILMSVFDAYHLLNGLEKILSRYETEKRITRIRSKNDQEVTND